MTDTLRQWDNGRSRTIYTISECDNLGVELFQVVYYESSNFALEMHRHAFDFRFGWDWLVD